MFKASLLAINGSNRGSRFEFGSGQDIVIGRSVGCNIRLDDSEVSRFHARVSHNGREFVLRDMNSANGTKVNGTAVQERVLFNGDSLQIGTSVLAFRIVDDAPPVNAGGQVRFVEDSRSLEESAILQRVSPEAAVLETAPRSGPELLYHVAEELVTPVSSLDGMLLRILELTVAAANADRGCVLLRDPVGADLTAIASTTRNRAVSRVVSGAVATDGPTGPASTSGPASQMPVSRSITDYVLRHGVAVLTSNAGQDDRFAAGQSIVSAGIREAICAPMRGRSDLLGVVYLDITTPLDMTKPSAGQRLTNEHLRTVVTVARQAALAIESRQFQDAMLKAERFAAMGQTITVLSHHIKNILQGVRGGTYLIRMGLDQHKEDLIRQGWGIVDRNQTRIYDLVMDMLSFSKDRVPSLLSADLNAVVSDVVELIRLRASELSVVVEFRRGDDVPTAMFDAEGIHRAVLNIVSNAIDAVEGIENGAVVIQTGYDKAADMLLVAVSDNGPGIPEDQRAAIFNVFESSKGSRGTGIGLPVSRKILREHGGRIRIEGGPGQGTRFVFSWPRGTPAATDSEPQQQPSS